MNRLVGQLTGRMSLRHPQRRALEILDRVVEIVPPRRENPLASSLDAIRSEYPTVTDFERDFPSLCFALATGVGKTRLMGAFIAYLHLAHGINHFFVLAPNLTIYDKLITDFTPNTPKYVFKGIPEFATTPPEIVTGENYASTPLLTDLIQVKINIFNISKINTEVRGGKAPKIKRLSEYLGESYFDHLAALPDLVMIMDESHRYRASAGIRAINELKPILGLELTATPFTESTRGPVPFKNVIYDYPLAQAMIDGFVKEPAVVTRKDFNASGMAESQLERLKLEDGIRIHESVKVELETYARERYPRQLDEKLVKPFVLVIAKNTEHAGNLLALIKSEGFFEGRYRERVIQVDSSPRGAEESEEMVHRLLAVEKTDEPTEIVIHVNMLKEGWDVTNLYTIVPLRAANARTLIEQSIGRGLRLPYGKRTGVSSVDRLNIVAHDKFQEIVDEAARADSPIRKLHQIVLDAAPSPRRPATVVCQPVSASEIGLNVQRLGESTQIAPSVRSSIFDTPAERKIAALTVEAIRNLENKPDEVRGIGQLIRPEIQAQIVRAVTEQVSPAQLELEGVAAAPDIAAIVRRTTECVLRGSIDIPRIVVLPKGERRMGYKPFSLDLSSLALAPVAEEIWIQHLRTREREMLGAVESRASESRPEDYIVRGLVDFDDVSYDDHADLLYALAGQVVEHFRSRFDEAELTRILRFHDKQIAQFVHAQMQQNFHEEATEYEARVTRGFTEIKEIAFTEERGQAPHDFKVPPEDRSNMAKYIFGGFCKCLYSLQKFHSDTERRMAVLLDRDSEKWFKPAQGQVRISYRLAGELKEYVPDFIAELPDMIVMIETKARNELESPDVLAKTQAAVTWCEHASKYSAEHGGKPWKYALIPHLEVTDNKSLKGFIDLFKK